MSTALVIVDVTRDLGEGGALEVPGGDDVAAAVSRHLATHGDDYAHVVATRDRHVDPGPHFSPDPDHVDSWPPHGVAGTPGAELHPALDSADVEAVFGKGEHQGATSGFDGICEKDGWSLRAWLHARGVDTVDVVGLTTDHGVRATALDAVRHGFTTRVPLALTAGWAKPSTDAACEEMRAHGVVLTGAPVLR